MIISEQMIASHSIIDYNAGVPPLECTAVERGSRESINEFIILHNSEAQINGKMNEINNGK